MNPCRNAAEIETVPMGSNVRIIGAYPDRSVAETGTALTDSSVGIIAVSRARNAVLIGIVHPASNVRLPRVYPHLNAGSIAIVPMVSYAKITSVCHSRVVVGTMNVQATRSAYSAAVKTHPPVEAMETVHRAKPVLRVNVLYQKIAGSTAIVPMVSGALTANVSRGAFLTTNVPMASSV